MTNETFRVPNIFIQHSYGLYATSRRGQLYLPGMAPFGPFDFWATLALYHGLDQERPGASVSTSAKTLLETLEFTKIIADADAGYETFPSESYQLLYDSLYRLYSVEFTIESFFNFKPDKGPGRPQKRKKVYFGRILESFSFVYTEGVTPPEAAPRSKRVNVNRATTPEGQQGPPIWKLAGHRPIGVEYRFASTFIEGFKGEGIGATVFPIQLFSLRPQLQPQPIATRFVVWTIRQTNKKLTRTLDGLISELQITGKDKQRNRRKLLEHVELAESLGIIKAVEYDPDGDRLRFTKGDEWHFPTKGKKAIEEGEA